MRGNNFVLNSVIDLLELELNIWDEDWTVYCAGHAYAENGVRKAKPTT